MLSRLALRLAAVEALCPAATVATGPYPTIAGARVYDSRIDLIDVAYSLEDIEELREAIENKPLLSVYTEDQHTDPYGEVKYNAAENVATLVVEALIGSVGLIEYETKNEAGETETRIVGTIEAPTTDRQREALLDLLEAQVRFVLTYKNEAPTAALFRKVAMETRTVHSDPQRAADRGVKLASRTIKFHTKIKQDQWKRAPEGGLPEPLATVAAALPAGSSGRQICDDIAASCPVLSAIPAAVATNGIVFSVAVDRPPDADADLVGFVQPALPPDP